MMAAYRYRLIADIEVDAPNILAAEQALQLMVLFEQLKLMAL